MRDYDSRALDSTKKQDPEVLFNRHRLHNLNSGRSCDDGGDGDDGGIGGIAAARSPPGAHTSDRSYGGDDDDDGGGEGNRTEQAGHFRPLTGPTQIHRQPAAAQRRSGSAREGRRRNWPSARLSVPDQELAWLARR